MSGEITRWSPGSSDELSRWNPERRELERKGRKIVNDARLRALSIDADAAVAYTGMERITDLDNERHRLAGGDPTLNQLLAEVEIAFTRKVTRTVRDF